VNITVSITGIKRAQKIVAETEGKLEEASKEMAKDLSDKVYASVIRHIDKQDLPWRKLSERYKTFKINQGLSDKIYEATGEFKNNIVVRKEDARDVYRIGAFSDIQHNPSGLSMSKLAAILEFGADVVGIPPRPLWRVAQAEMGAMARGETKKYVRQLAKKIVKEVR
jgi:hypothetical protein